MSKGAASHGKKSKAILAVFLALLFTASAAYLIGRRLSDGKKADVHTASQDVRVLFEADFDHIASVLIDPGCGDPYILTVKNGALVLRDNEEYPIRDQILALIGNNIRLVRAENTIIDTLAERVPKSAYGFAPYRCKAEITDSDGRRHTILIGDQIRGDIPYYYFMFDNDPNIYAGSTDMHSAFSYEYSMLHPVPDLRINTEIAEEVALTGALDFSFYYTDMGWQMRSPFEYPLSESFSDGYLKNISALSLARYITTADTGMNLEAFGLDEPYLEIRIQHGESVISVPVPEGNDIHATIPAYTTELLIGNPYDEYSRYALFEGSLYTVSDFRIDVLTDFSMSRALKAQPFQTALSVLNSVRVKTDGSSGEYVLIFEKQKDAAGNELYDDGGQLLYNLEVYRDGVKIEANRFANWFLQLQGIKILGEVPVGQSLPDSGPVAEIRLSSLLHERLISFYPISQTQLLMTVDGTGLYFTDESALEYFRQAP